MLAAFKSLLCNFSILCNYTNRDRRRNFSVKPVLNMEEKMAMHSSILAWKIPWMVVPGRLLSMGHKESDMTEGLSGQAALNSGN